MIDYLAAVLGEVQAELEGLAPRRVVLGRRAAPEAQGAEDEAGEKKESLLSPAAEVEKVLWLEEGAEGEAPVLAALDRAEETAATASGWTAAGGREEDGGVLYRSLRKAARVAQVAEGGREPVTVALPAGTAESAGGDWSGLDRAVERDARRYDGGFPLY